MKKSWIYTYLFGNRADTSTSCCIFRHFDEFPTAMASVDIEKGIQSPRISFSVYLSQTDIVPAEKQESENDLKCIKSDADFEFCVANKLNVNGSGNPILADELAVEESILPQIRPEDENFAEQYTPEVLHAAAPDSNPKGTMNDGAKPSKVAAEEVKDRKEMNNNNGITRASFSLSSRWPFTRSRSKSLPFSRSKSAGERKSKVESVFSGRSRSVGAANPRCEDLKSAAKVQTSRRELRRSSKNEGSSRSFGDVYGEIYVASYRDVYGRSPVGNTERCGSQAWKSAGMNSSRYPRGGGGSMRETAPPMNVGIGGHFCFCTKAME